MGSGPPNEAKITRNSIKSMYNALIMQLLNFSLHYAWIVLTSWLGIALLAVGVLQLGEWALDLKAPIPRSIRLTAFVALLFLAQAAVYKKLFDKPPVVLRTSSPPPPTFPKEELSAQIMKSSPNSPVQVNSAALGTRTSKIAQSGQNNIAQVGDNNQATINPQPPEKNWVITEDICRKLLGAIRSTGSIQVSIGAFISDPDGANVVNQLARCLPSVQGWTVGRAVLPPVPDAVTVTTSAENEPIAMSLRDGLRTIGFDANLRIIPNAIDMEIVIGKHALKQP